MDRSGVVQRFNSNVGFKGTIKDGKDEYLKMLFLNKYGHVNLFGPNFKDEKDLAENDVAAKGSKPRLQQTERIAERLQTKSAKSYPDNCLLVIVFDDTGFNESEIQHLQLEIHAALQKTQSSFAGIILLGFFNETFVEIISS